MLAASALFKPARAAGPARAQRGVFLIEALLAILIFSLGILTLVAIQTTAISAQSDAQYRSEAANLANLVNYGGSPRATISLALASKAYAFIKRRGYVIPEDVRAVCMDVLRHRIGVTYEAEAEEVTSETIVQEILNKIEVP